MMIHTFIKRSEKPDPAMKKVSIEKDILTIISPVMWSKVQEIAS